MPRFTARVHGYGLVDWTATDVDAYAHSLRSQHVPAKRWLVQLGTPCAACGERWPCPAYAWVEQWTSHEPAPSTPRNAARREVARPEIDDEILLTKGVRQ